MVLLFCFLPSGGIPKKKQHTLDRSEAQLTSWGNGSFFFLPIVYDGFGIHSRLCRIFEPSTVWLYIQETGRSSSNAADWVLWNVGSQHFLVPKFGCIGISSCIQKFKSLVQVWDRYAVIFLQFSYLHRLFSIFLLPPETGLIKIFDIIQKDTLES